MKNKKALSKIKALALAYLLEPMPAKKFGILLKAEKYFEALTYTTKGKLFKDLGISYFASVDSSQKVERVKRKTFKRLSFTFQRVKTRALIFAHLQARVAVWLA